MNSLAASWASAALLLAGVFWSVRLHRDRPPEHAA